MNKFGKKIFLPIFALLMLASCSDFFNDAKKSGAAIVVPPEPVFSVTVSKDIKNGSVSASCALAAKGTRIELSNAPATGYALSAYAVAGEDGSSVPVADGKFTMPAQNVVVSATFAAIPAASGAYAKIGSKTINGVEYDLVTFGLWPQTIKAANVTVNDSESKAAGAFTYCKGSDGQWYVKIKERACHPVCKYSDGTTAKESSADSWKWFKVEPIKWRVLTTNYNGTGKKLLFAESVLANSVYYDYQSVNRTVGGKTIHPNNYEHSRVRAFLNGLSYQRKASADGQQTACDDFLGKGFLQTAFTADELAIIADTSVDNSERSTFPNANAKQWNNGENPYASDTPTTDKVFLLSLQEVTTGAYGFDEDHNAAGVGNARIRPATDYARASGANQNGAEGLGGWWWQRSPFYGDDYSARYADRDGDSFYSAIVSEVYEGVGYGDIVPALCVGN